MGFEPTRAEPNGLAVHRLNHSATSSTEKVAVCVDAVSQTLDFLENMMLSNYVGETR